MTAVDLVAETFATTQSPGGVCVADGHGLRIAIERRHLVVSDGVGHHRRQRRYPRVGHGLRRLVVMGRSGTVSLDALRWMDRVGIYFAQIDTDGTLLTASASPSLDDARLRRSQALAADTLAGTDIVRRLLDDKIAGQAHVARTRLKAAQLAQRLDALRLQLPNSSSLDEARDLEAQAAHAYFAAWHTRVAFRWATEDAANIPEHWTAFAARRSPLTSGSPSTPLTPSTPPSTTSTPSPRSNADTPA